MSSTKQTESDWSLILMVVPFVDSLWIKPSGPTWTSLWQWGYTCAWQVHSIVHHKPGIILLQHRNNKAYDSKKNQHGSCLVFDFT